MTSKFSIWKVYFPVFFGTVFFIGYGLLLIFSKPKLGDSKSVLLFFGLVCIAFGAYTLYTYIKKLPVVRIDDSGINLRSIFVNSQFSWATIQSIKYTGKASFVLGTRMESLSVLLNDETTIHIFYDHYSNGHIIQQYIKCFHEHQDAPVLIDEPKVSAKEILNESFRVYKGVPILSFRGILIWGFILFVLYFVVVNYPGSKIIIPAGIFCVFWYIVHSYVCFYIRLSENYLVIKNYFFPFPGKRYRLSDIQEVVIETQSKWPNCLRVINNSYRYKLFPCGTLRDSDWKAFIHVIEKKGIKVRDEAIF